MPKTAKRTLGGTMRKADKKKRFKKKPRRLIASKKKVSKKKVVIKKVSKRGAKKVSKRGSNQLVTMVVENEDGNKALTQSPVKAATRAETKAVIKAPTKAVAKAPTKSLTRIDNIVKGSKAVARRASKKGKIGAAVAAGALGVAGVASYLKNKDKKNKTKKTAMPRKGRPKMGSGQMKRKKRMVKAGMDTSRAAKSTNSLKKRYFNILRRNTRFDRTRLVGTGKYNRQGHAKSLRESRQLRNRLRALLSPGQYQAMQKQARSLVAGIESKNRAASGARGRRYYDQQAALRKKVASKRRGKGRSKGSKVRVNVYRPTKKGMRELRSPDRYRF